MKVYKSKSSIAGVGMFAGQDIKKDSTILIIKGTMIRDEDTETDCYLEGPNWIGITDKIWLIIDKDCPAEYINHSCNPNAGIIGKVTLKAMRDIAKDEEITMDYSTTESDETWQMDCGCGNDNCRHVIKSVQFLSKELIGKYYDYMPTYMKGVVK